MQSADEVPVYQACGHRSRGTFQTRRDISPPLIAIEALAASSSLGGLDALWQAWFSAARPPIAPRQPDDWQRRTHEVAQQVLQHATAQQRPATGLVLATTKGDIEQQVRWMRAAISADPPTHGVQALACPEPCRDKQAKACTPRADVPCPTLGSETARIAAAAQLAGPCWAISTACSSGLVALIDAAIALRNGEAPHFLVLAADEATDFVHDGFAALHALSNYSCRPFDRNRDGLMLGSAAAAALLTPAPKCSALAVISGWGLSNDATHMTAPDRAASGLIRATRQALAMARLAPEQIDVMLAHGTGTRYNDAMEVLAIREIFDVPRQKGPAVTAVKGLVGHTLGASGLLEAALAVKMLQHQIVPAIFGLEHPEYPDIDFVTTPRHAKICHILKTASGFGGLNAAVILSTPVISTTHD